jgi:hypothetical protein
VDRIEAYIRLRDAKRFRADTKLAAEGVEQIGDEATGAAAKLALLDRQMNNMGGGSSSVLGKLGVSLNNVSGRLRLIGTAALVSWPSVVALGSSLAGAAGGAALLGGAGMAAAITGLSGLAFVSAT